MRGVGEKTLQAITEAARGNIPALLSSALRAANVVGKLVFGHLGPKEWREVMRQTGLTRLNTGTIQRIYELAQIFAELRSMVDEGQPVGDLVGELLDGQGVGLARYFAGLDEAGKESLKWPIAQKFGAIPKLARMILKLLWGTAGDWWKNWESRRVKEWYVFWPFWQSSFSG
jgi:hypothetical protein